MEISPWDQFFQRLLPSLASDDGPDLVAMDTAQLPQYVARGAFRPLDDYYEDPSTESDALVQAAVDATKWDGVAYGVPMNFTTLLLYWNKGMFEEAGLDPEAPPETWEEFADYAVQLTGDGQYGLAIADNNTIPMWPILLWGNGGGVVSDDGTTSLLDAPETIEALELLGWPRPRRGDLADRARRRRCRQPVPDRAGGDGDRRAVDDDRVHRGRDRLRPGAATGWPCRTSDARHQRRLRHQR